jgi:uncharacterized membrane protein
MLLKHIVVVVFLALGVAVDMLVRRASEAEDDVRRAIALRRVRLCAEAATATGAVIILLTAAAQVAG